MPIHVLTKTESKTEATNFHCGTSNNYYSVCDKGLPVVLSLQWQNWLVYKHYTWLLGRLYDFIKLYYHFFVLFYVWMHVWIEGCKGKLNTFCLIILLSYKCLALLPITFKTIEFQDLTSDSCFLHSFIRFLIFSSLWVHCNIIIVLLFRGFSFFSI